MTDENDWARALIARRRSERHEKITTVRKFAEALPDEFGVRAVVVFGSVARGDFNLWSDIDVLVIADDLPTDSRDGLPTLQSYVSPTLQPLVWTPAEFEERLARSDPIAIEAKERGIVVRGSLVA